LTLKLFFFVEIERNQVDIMFSMSCWDKCMSKRERKREKRKKRKL